MGYDFRIPVATEQTRNRVRKIAKKQGLPMAKVAEKIVKEGIKSLGY